MDKIISEVNKLQTTLVDAGWEQIQLPHVVLVGDQGCGKSSVLEALIGECFIPEVRSTRRPIFIQLVHFPSETEEKEAWVEFAHRPNKVYRDVHGVREELEAETERLAGSNRGISTVPITLKYYSPKVMDFTIIDLPGLTRVQVGDQPPDIENKIKKYVQKLMRDPNSIIIAVVAGNTDIETSEVLQLALGADPAGIRTLCVVTKLDLMDAGTNATQVLLGNIVNIRLGIIGMIGRSQRDIDEGMTMPEAELKEKAFFERYYNAIAEKHGSTYLCEQLYKLLVKSIKVLLPVIEKRIQEDLEGYTNSILPFGKHVIDSQEGLLCFLTKFVGSYSDAVTGTGRNVGTDELEGGARIGYIFQEVFVRTLEVIDPMEGYTSTVVLTALRNSSGTKPYLFVPQNCFEELVKRQIVRLIDPSFHCVTLVQEELIRMTYECDRELSKQMERFPKLRTKIYEVVNNLVKSRFNETTEMIQNLIKMHTAYINTAHPDFLDENYQSQIFVDNLNGLNLFEKRHSPSAYTFLQRGTGNEVGVILNSLTDECVLMETMIKSYFNIIRKCIADAVPKIIMHFMVNYTSDHLMTELVASIYSDGDPTALLEEEPSIASQRQRMNNSIQALNSTLSTIENFTKL